MFLVNDARTIDTLVVAKSQYDGIISAIPLDPILDVQWKPAAQLRHKLTFGLPLALHRYSHCRHMHGLRHHSQRTTGYCHRNSSLSRKVD